MSKDKPIVLGIDFNNMLIGSYYGEKLYNSKGMNVNAVKGFFFRLKMLKDIFNPDYILFANDLSRERTFRRKLYKPYKAQRKELDPEIPPQMQAASQIVALLGYKFINNEEYEADDILGMISRYVNERDMYMIIASSDRDLYQLITNDTFIYSPRNKDLIDKSFMYNKYKLLPDQWVEYKMLLGDTSDNIPGIPGIGEVTAMRLMQEFKSIDEIYKHLNSLKPAIRESLLKHKDQLPLTRELVTIITDHTKIELNDECFKRNEIFIGELYKLINDLEIYSLIDIMKYSLIYDKI